ncbi:MAG: (Fe-S)-binding protein [Endomicrobiia bacterium]|nr:(Fe-S)-binding protein [Endomicrobiia bacterium]
MFLTKVSIISALPCVAESGKIRYIAEFDADISATMPYLNAIFENAVYNHEGKNITLVKDGMMIGLHGRRIAAGKVKDIAAASRLNMWLVDIVNDVWRRFSEITPNYERRRKPSAVDLYKLLPQTNCGRCGEKTCIAFALNLAEEQKNVIVCADLFS